MNRIHSCLLATVVGTSLVVGCGSNGGDPPPQTQPGSSSLLIQDVPASRAVTATTGVADWKLEKDGDAYVTRGYDARGTEIATIAISWLKDDAGKLVSYTMEASGSDHKPSTLVGLADGQVVENTLATGSKELPGLFNALQIDFNVQGRQLSVSETPYMSMACGVALLLVVGAAGGAGAGCAVAVGCAFGIVGAVGAVGGAMLACG